MDFVGKMKAKFISQEISPVAQKLLKVLYKKNSNGNSFYIQINEVPFDHF